MNINDFVNEFNNYPILFIGSGFSHRYLKKSFTWENLLKKIVFDVTGNYEKYYDLKEKSFKDGVVDYAILSENVEAYFNEEVTADRNGKFKFINDQFYSYASKDVFVSKFKLYITYLLSSKEINDDKIDEIRALKTCSRNIATMITTNYDTFIEDTFSFNPLIGNDILFNNPYGAIYKIHGSVEDPQKIIITKSDYELFEKKYELIQAQLISMFISNPIIFIGYSITDNNIKKLLNTIFSYVDPLSPVAEKIRKNFLLVEYSKNSKNVNIEEHDIVVNPTCVIRINKIKTDNFLEIYNALNSINLPISAMDIRKVQNIVKEIISVNNGNIKVEIESNLDDLSNGSKILFIGNKQEVQYIYKKPEYYISHYFTVDDSLLSIINDFPKSNMNFPYFKFSSTGKIRNSIDLCNKQANNIKSSFEKIKIKNFGNQKFFSIDDIIKNKSISNSNKNPCIFLNVYEKNITLDELKAYILQLEKIDTWYRKLICLYDYCAYSKET